jgi:hypothetical protein
LAREIFKKRANFCTFFDSADQIHPQKPQISQNLKIGPICLITARPVDTCAKNWAAVRREERRELPQPVVIVQHNYAGRFDWFGEFNIFAVILFCVKCQAVSGIFRENML